MFWRLLEVVISVVISVAVFGALESLGKAIGPWVLGPIDQQTFMDYGVFVGTFATAGAFVAWHVYRALTAG